MPDPSSTLRQMVLFDGEFDVARVRVLCLMITAPMRDKAAASRLMQAAVDEIMLLDGLLAISDVEDVMPGYLREDAVAALG